MTTKRKISKKKRREYTQKYEQKHPFRNKYFKTRYNAKRRGIEFTIEYEEFRDILISGYAFGKTGRTKDCLSLDRIDPRLGYVSGNVQLLTVSLNSSKGSTIPEDEQPDWYLNRPKDDCPF